MIFRSFRFLPKSYVGIDIGTAAVKAVELGGWGERRTLKNYGEIKSETLYSTPFRTFEKNTLVLSNKEIARAIQAILKEGNIKSKEAIFSIPDFSSFFTNFQLPPMPKKELPEAVRFEARRHIPVPLSEVAFDWQLIGQPQGKEKHFT